MAGEEEEDLSFLEAEVEQHLTLRDFYIVTIQDTDEPPEFDVIQDVEHIETGHGWRQSQSFGRDQFIQYIRMLMFAAAAADVEID